MKEKVKEFYLITDGNGNYTHDDTLEEAKKLKAEEKNKKQ